MANKDLIPRSAEGSLGSVTSTWAGVFSDSLSAGSLSANSITSHTKVLAKTLVVTNEIAAAEVLIDTDLKSVNSLFTATGNLNIIQSSLVSATGNLATSTGNLKSLLESCTGTLATSTGNLKSLLESSTATLATSTGNLKSLLVSASGTLATSTGNLKSLLESSTATLATATGNIIDGTEVFSGTNIFMDTISGNSISAVGITANIVSAGALTSTTISSDALTSGHHMPAADNTYDLGSTTKRWNDLHLSGATIYMYEAGGTTTFTRTDINKLKRGETLKGDLSISATTISAQRISTTVGLFSNMDTTPDISTGCLFRTANLGPTSISGFDGGAVGQRIIIIIGDLRTDFIDDDSAASYPLKLQRARDWTTPATNDTIEFVFNGTDWYELTRSDNS